MFDREETGVHLSEIKSEGSLSTSRGSTPSGTMLTV